MLQSRDRDVGAVPHCRDAVACLASLRHRRAHDGDRQTGNDDGRSRIDDGCGYARIGQDLMPPRLPHVAGPRRFRAPCALELWHAPPKIPATIRAMLHAPTPREEAIRRAMHPGWPRPMSCLRCSRRHTAEHPGHRLCERCRGILAERDVTEYEILIPTWH